MMRAYGLGLPLLALLSSCANIGSETFTSDAGETYTVERSGSFGLAQLPTSSDLKMAGGDLVKFAAEKCGLSGPAGTGPDQCDLYVQPDRKGSLIGYATVRLSKGRARFDTATTTNEMHQPANASCDISGGLHQTGENYAKPVSDLRHDYHAQIMYSAWDRGNGALLVSDIGDDPDSANPQGSLGVWYITVSGDKLRLEQERWNFCYSDPSVTIDDVFYRLIRLTRSAPAAR